MTGIDPTTHTGLPGAVGGRNHAETCGKYARIFTGVNKGIERIAQTYRMVGERLPCLTVDPTVDPFPKEKCRCCTIQLASIFFFGRRSGEVQLSPGVGCYKKVKEK